MSLATIVSSINGYKTYALAVISIIYAIAGFFTGHMSSKESMEIILASLGAMSIRHGISNP